MKFEKKKVPAKPKSHKGYSKEYPMFAFRVPQSESSKARLERIRANVETIYEAFLKKKEDRDKVINRNDILFEALDKGLIQIKKESI